MALKGEVLKLCNKLTKNGWRDLILSVTNNELDIKQSSANKLKEALLKPIDEINRGIPGFDDYRLDGNQGITPRSFSKSLLYHALASPNVVDSSLTYYPSLEDLDLIENFIYSLGIQIEEDRQSLARLKERYGSKLVIAVFAYQYRTWEESSHRAHADMNYARTGISRVGTAKPVYDSERRSFWVGDEDGHNSVLPCRYGAFLAIKEKGRNIQGDFSIMDATNRDNSLDFVVPIYKLFNGSECLLDTSNLELNFESYHRNEKLRRTHDSQIRNTIPINSDYDQNEFPFVIDDNTQPGFLYSVSNFMGSLIVEPTEGKTSEPAIQNGKYVAFNVPRINETNRFNSSFQIPAINGNWREAPEYVNIRQRVESTNVINPEVDIEDLNDLPLHSLNDLLNGGGYLAVDFIDRTADGIIKVINFDDLPNYAAYSLITAIDFFPLVNQRDIYRWDNSDNIRHFSQGGSRPISDGRIQANINHFISEDTRTHSAVVSSKKSVEVDDNLKSSNQLSLSYLPDAASGVFAPGWDISMDIENGTPFYAAYGLGSPFPEDAKLCAALNSFWPAAAPDASRTFFVSKTLSSNIRNGGAFDSQFLERKPAAIPLTDEELGIYPRYANAIGVASKLGWDGEHGPFIETDVDGEYVNYADIARSDYTLNAWNGLMNMDLLKKITTSQLIDRMEALQRCILELLPPDNDSVIENKLWLVSFKEITDWNAQTDKMDANLNGNGFQFIFITPDSDTPIFDSTDKKRLKMKVDKKYECQLDKNTFVWRAVTPVNTIVFNNNDIPNINFISGNIS